jgi:hypothetical protein
MMENSEDTRSEELSLRFAAFVYHGVMLAAFVIGLYGLFSLFSLAGAEIQHSVNTIGSLR